MESPVIDLGCECTVKLQLSSTGKDERVLKLYYNRKHWLVSVNEDLQGRSCVNVASTSRTKCVPTRMVLYSDLATWRFEHEFPSEGKIWTVRVDAMMAVSSEVTVNIVVDKTARRIDGNEKSTEERQVPKLHYISTRRLRVADKNILVAQELLALQSRFFETLFYQDFSESRQDTISIEAFSHEEMAFFCDAATRSNMPPLTRKTACTLLELSDYFDATELRKTAVDYLKTAKLRPSLSMLTRILHSGDRYKEPEIVDNVVNVFHTQKRLLKYVESLPDYISTETMKKFVKRACQLFEFPDGSDQLFYLFAEGLVVVKLHADLEDRTAILMDVYSHRPKFGTLRYVERDRDERHKLRLSVTHPTFRQAGYSSDKTSSKYYLYVGSNCADHFLTPINSCVVGNVVKGEEVLANNKSLTLIKYGVYTPDSPPCTSDEESDDDGQRVEEQREHVL